MVTHVVVRSVAMAVCVAGIAGMIGASIAGSNGAALTAGVVTVVAVLCSIVATSVVQTAPASDDADELGALVEAGVEQLVADGTDEQVLRQLVADAVRLGRVTR